MDSRKRACLEAMGIAVWERRTADPDPSPVPSAPRAAADAALEQPLAGAAASSVMTDSRAESAIPAAGPVPSPSSPDGPPIPDGTAAVPGAVPEAEAIPDGETSVAGGLDWDGLAAAVGACERCPELVANRSRTVFGVGNRAADLLVIGEAPGADEDRQGEPFVGRAGKLLDAMLAAIGFARGRNAFIANVLKCRPPNNRDPKPEEVTACAAYLERQIELVKPKVILVVGRIAAQSLLASDQPIGKLRGQLHHLGEHRMPLVVTYHPAYLLRSPGEKRKAWDDLRTVRRLLAESA